MKHEIPAHATLRPGTVDRDIWCESIEGNVYRLPEMFAPGDWVLDLGAHTGSVAWRCAVSGARVVAVECARDNYSILLDNLKPVADRVVPINAAVWRGDRPCVIIPYEQNWLPANTGGGCTMGDAGTAGHDVVGIPLDYLLAMQSHWRLLKVDIEGAEFPVLYTSRELHRVEAIAGEYHERDRATEWAAVGQPYRMIALSSFLRLQGYTVEVLEMAPGCGYFFASRAATVTSAACA